MFILKADTKEEGRLEGVWNPWLTSYTFLPENNYENHIKVHDR